MGQAISTEHPAVVLRSRYRQLRALLAVALVVAAALAAAVVILALDDDTALTVSTPAPVSAPAPTGHDESSTAAAIGAAYDPQTGAASPDESKVAAEIAKQGKLDSTTPQQQAAAFVRGH